MSYRVSQGGWQVVEDVSQGEIGCFRNSEMLLKPDGSKFHCVSTERFRQETCKMKMEAFFLCFCSASVDLNMSAHFHHVSTNGFVLKFAGFHDQSLVSHIIKFVLTVLITLQAR